MPRTLQIRYFASLVDRTGCSAEQVEIDDGLNVAGLWRELIRRHPALDSLAYRPLVACDLQYADWEQALQEVCEVGFLPPVSGG